MFINKYFNFMTNNRVWRSAVIGLVAIVSLVLVAQPTWAMSREEINDIIRERIAELRELCADKDNPDRKLDCKKLENILKWFKDEALRPGGSSGPAVGYQDVGQFGPLFNEAVNLRQLWYNSGYTESSLKKQMDLNHLEISKNINEEQLLTLFAENNYDSNNPKTGIMFLRMGDSLSSAANLVVLQAIKLHMQAPNLIYNTDDKRLAAVIKLLAGLSDNKTSYTECSFGSKIGYCSSLANGCYCKTVFDFKAYNKALTSAQDRINQATSDTQLKKAYDQAFSLMAGYLRLAKPYLSK